MGFPVSKPACELAKIIHQYREPFLSRYNPHPNTLKVLDAIMRCRTAGLGGHVDGCSQCGHLRISYNSCRNRHCPKCQNTSRERWIDQRQRDLLPVPYFHVVFTLPARLNPYCLKYPKPMYDILFSASKQTIAVFAADPRYLGAKMGMISLLHTWGQNLSLHPHIHMIVPAGGVSKAGFWKSVKRGGEFLFPVKAMSQVFKNKFMEQFREFLKSERQPLENTLRQSLYKMPWVVYAKKPFAGADSVIEYLGRYSHKVAISNHRIVAIDGGKVSFRYKDYADGSRQKTMTLDAVEFLRRFCLHILPRGFRKIRHYGLLASRCKPLLRIRQLQMGVLPAPLKDSTQICVQNLKFNPKACPCCKTGEMLCLLFFSANAPPSAQQLSRLRKQIKTKTQSVALSQ
jgi:hypothetical protein